MSSRKLVISLMPLLIACSGEVCASDIARPAGGLIQSERVPVSGNEGYGGSKSKVVPIRRIMNTSSAEKSAHTKKDVERSVPIKVAQAETRDANVAEPSGGDPWDSAARRFDQQDPANSVTKGVRVEDIIEPSSDYRYVAARRKNPFIPELRLGRAAAKQKELNPNDVEIPIINPLQSFPVAQLAVIGVWEGDDHVWKALIQTPTNQGIETKLGDPAGNSGGRIMTISPDAVIVREFSVRADGTREYRDIPIYMGSDKRDGDNGNVGGRLILRPGAATPQIEAPDVSQNIPATPPVIVPTNIPGTLSTIVPASEQLAPIGQPANSAIPGADIPTDNLMPAVSPGFQGGAL